MNITFKGTYKSIRDFDWDTIPDLAVLTGLNGSGKSQLLELLQQGYANLSHQNRPSPNMYVMEKGQLSFNGVEIKKMGILTWKSHGAYFQFQNHKFSYNDLDEIVKLILATLNPNQNLPLPKAQQNEQETTYEHQQSGINRLKHLIESKKKKIIEVLVAKTGKKSENITGEDILFFLPEDVLNEDQDVMTQDNLDMAFYLYLYKAVSLERAGESCEILGKPPWEVLNQILSSIGLPYHFSSPSREPIDAIFRNPLNRNSFYNFSVALLNEKEEKIGIENLSSGERVILSLAMLLYYFQHRMVRKNFILLDELDAHLHPSLTRQFFQVINQNIIQEYGAKVILATHSPSTVALSPDNSLFIIEKGDLTTRILPATKDRAINLLTAGVPSLSINYENRRQIFTESSYDAQYYDYVYTLVKPDLLQGVSLNFISSGVSAGTGNCDQVVKIVDALNKAGNKTIFGIIDWDKKNKPSRNVQVLGESRRYSMDTYVFDPLLMGYFLYKLRLISNDVLGVPLSFTLMDFRDLTNVQAQRIADTILSKLKGRFKDSTSNEMQTMLYKGGMAISLPVWYAHHYGHDLHKYYFDVFPGLQRYKDENTLRKAIYENTLSDLPLFLPKDIMELFQYFHTLPIHEEKEVV